MDVPSILVLRTFHHSLGTKPRGSPSGIRSAYDANTVHKTVVRYNGIASENTQRGTLGLHQAPVRINAILRQHSPVRNCLRPEKTGYVRRPSKGVHPSRIRAPSTHKGSYTSADPGVRAAQACGSAHLTIRGLFDSIVSHQAMIVDLSEETGSRSPHGILRCSVSDQSKKSHATQRLIEVGLSDGQGQSIPSTDGTAWQGTRKPVAIIYFPVIDLG